MTVDQIKRLFPWLLLLGFAMVLMLTAVVGRAHAGFERSLPPVEEDVWACYGAQRYQAMSSAWPACNEMSTLCVRVQQYLQSHTVEEGRAEGAKLNIPQWLRNKAERCIP